MQKIITKKCFLLFVALFSMVLQAQVTENQPAITPEMALALHTEALKQIEPLKIALQHVAQLTQAGVIKYENSQLLLQWAFETMQVINSHQLKAQNQPAELITIGQILLFNQALLNHILSAFKHNFQHLIPLSPDTIIQRNGLIEITPERLDKIFQDNMQSLQRLEKEAKRFGVSYTNQFFRTLDRMINLPIVKPTLRLAMIGLCGYVLYKGTKHGMFLIDNQLGTTFHSHMFGDSSPFLHEILPAIPPMVVAETFKGTGVAVIQNLLGKVTEPFLSGYRMTNKFMDSAWSKLKGDEKDPEHHNGSIIEDITLDHPSLIGMEEQKQKLYDNIIQPVLHPELYMQGTQIERAILLAGESGCGKTLAMRATCGTINAEYKKLGSPDRLRFREVSHPEIRMRNLKSIIQEAQEHGPMILFIDEYHLLRTQTTANVGELVEQLTELETLYLTNDPRKLVILVVATNRPDMIAEELFRHKRFGLTIRFEKPNYLQRNNFFKQYAQQSAITLSEENIDSFAAQTHNCSYSDLDQIFQDAKIKAKQLVQSLQAHHIQAAINNYVHHIKISVSLTEEEQKIAAAHFAGRALTHHVLAINEKIELITLNAIDRTIKEREEFLRAGKDGIRQSPKNDKIYKPRYGKMVTYNSHEAMNVRTADEMLKLAQRRLAGIIAEEVLLGTRSMTYHPNDRQKALDIIKSVLLQGLKEEQLPEKQREEIITQALERIIKLETDVRMLLQTNKTILEKIYQALLEKETLMGPDFRALIS